MCPKITQGPKCYKCHARGHISKDYETNKSKDNILKRISRCDNIMNVEINTVKIDALVDTGRSFNLIRSDYVDSELYKNSEKTCRSFQGLEGSTIEPLMK